MTEKDPNKMLESMWSLDNIGPQTERNEIESHRTRVASELVGKLVLK